MKVSNEKGSSNTSSNETNNVTKFKSSTLEGK